MTKVEQTIHNIYRALMWGLGIVSLYLLVGYSLPSTWFFQDINVNSGGGDIDMSFVTEFKGQGTGSVINTMNCTSDLLIKEKQIVEVLPLIYKKIEIVKPILTGN